MADPIKLLIVDDSKLMRRVISGIFEGVEEVTVVGEAENGKIALEMIPSLKPDVVTMDINMPVMDGLKALKHIMIKHPTPVVMCSTLTGDGRTVTFDALKFGAVDFIHKPSNHHPETLEAQHETIRRKVIQAARVEIEAVRYSRGKPGASAIQGNAYNCVCGIGAAEGGYSALLKIIPRLRPDIPAAFVLVLYEASQNVNNLVRYLDDNSALKVERAIDAMPIEGGVLYIASGEEDVTIHSFYGEYLKVAVDASPNTRNSIDRMLLSLDEVMKDKAAGLILSGSGGDGLEGMNAIARSGGATIVQDPKTCLFREMPEAVIEYCPEAKVISDNRIADVMNNGEVGAFA